MMNPMGHVFKDYPNFQDDLSKKPLFQQLWAKDAIHKTLDEINKPSRMLSLFLGCNTFVDHEIGRVLEVIDKEVPDALVIFTSDHGDMLGAHRLQGKNACAYKEITNIPLIIRGGEQFQIRLPILTLCLQSWITWGFRYRRSWKGKACCPRYTIAQFVSMIMSILNLPDMKLTMMDLGACR